MQLRTARLCLDCEEVHEENTCPICASEMFAYLTRWVPAEEQRPRRRPSVPEAAPEKVVRSGMTRWMQRGVVGLAVVAAGRWLLENTRPSRGAEPTERRGAAGGQVKSWPQHKP